MALTVWASMGFYGLLWAGFYGLLWAGFYGLTSMGWLLWAGFYGQASMGRLLWAGFYGSVHNSATFPMLLLKSSKKVVILNEISRK